MQKWLPGTILDSQYEGKFEGKFEEYEPLVKYTDDTLVIIQMKHSKPLEYVPKNSRYLRIPTDKKENSLTFSNEQKEEEVDPINQSMKLNYSKQRLGPELDQFYDDSSPCELCKRPYVECNGECLSPAIIREECKSEGAFFRVFFFRPRSSFLLLHSLYLSLALILWCTVYWAALSWGLFVCCASFSVAPGGKHVLLVFFTVLCRIIFLLLE